MRVFLDTWGILVAKMFDLGVKWGILEEQKCDFRVKWGIFLEKMCDWGDNGVFLERKCKILWKMRDFARENVCFWG